MICFYAQATCTGSVLAFCGKQGPMVEYHKQREKELDRETDWLAFCLYLTARLEMWKKEGHAKKALSAENQTVAVAVIWYAL